LNGRVRKPAVACLILLLAGACLAPVETTTTSTTVVTIADGRDLTIVDCGAGRTDFDLVCEGYGLIQSNYVDPVDDQALADAALAGLESVDAPAADEGDAPLVCPIPAPAFIPVCEQAAEIDADQEAMAEAALAAMVAEVLDPNSAYFDPGAFEQLREEDDGHVEGIGALVATESTPEPEPGEQACTVIGDDCRLVVTSTIPDSPAARAGVEAEDVIVAVDGESIDGWPVDLVTAKVRGPAGTKVEITVERAGAELDFEIERAAIDLPVVESEMVGDVGYLRLNVFLERADRAVARALDGLIEDGAKSLVLDLRDNPGGSLEATVNIVSEFLETGVVLRTQAPGSDTPYPVRDGGLAQEIPMVVLVNEGSASASEVTAAALQEAGRALILGEPTYGKNTVQQRFDLQNGGALKLTTARWVTAEGNSFGGTGVTPDVAADLPGDLPVADLVAAAVRLGGL
jgi:carboxyl-terminal processing protease